eukprot:gene1146-1311_t
MATTRVFATLACLACLVVLSTASHYRGGSITWAPESDTNYNVINFKIELAFRTGFEPFESYDLEVGKYIRDYDWWNGEYIYENVNLGILEYGDPSGSSEYAHALVNSINDDFFTATVKFRKVYPLKDASYDATFYGEARIDNLANNGGLDYYMTTHIVIKKPTTSVPLNTAPVVNTYPLITVQRNVENSFQIVASDLETPNTLTFALASSSVMGGGVSNQVQPQGLSISSSGFVKFTPSQLGFYCCQIVISDGVNWVVADFLLNSVAATNQPPKFIAETPDENTPVQCKPNQACKWSYVGFTPLVGKSVEISVAYLPSSVDQGNPVGTGQTVYINNTWTPTVAQIGRHVVSLGIQDTSNPPIHMLGQRSFVIVVQAPTCGNGQQETNGTCTCVPGWDPSSACYECLPEFWGPQCKPNPACDHGTPSGGSLGDGTCSCYLGWTGPLCNVSIVQACDNNAKSGVVKVTNGQGYLSPASAQIYMMSAPYTYPLTVSMPKPLPAFDVYLLIDTMVSTTTAANIKDYIANYLSQFNSYGEGGAFGFGTYSFAASGGITFLNKLSIGSSILDDVKLIQYNTGTNSNEQLVFNTLQMAASTALGWRAGSHRTIIMIGSHDASTSNAALIKSTFDVLKAKSIMPVYISAPGTDCPNISGAMTANFGIFSKIAYVANESSGKWATAAFNAFIQASTTIKAFITDDASGFTTPPTINTIPSGTGKTAYVNTTFTLPATVPAAQSASVSLSVIGFGSTIITTVFNHAPVVGSAQITLYEDTPFPFTLAAVVSDSDSNVITIAFPVATTTTGTVTLGDGSAISTSAYPSTQQFKFVPLANAFGTTNLAFTVSDGCKSVTGNLVIVVNPVNDVPTCSGVSLTASASSPATFTLTGTDVDVPAQTLTVSLDSLTLLNAKGALTANGSPAAANTPYPVTTSFKFTPVNPASATTATVTYTVSDGTGSSTRCTITFTIAHENVAPVASALSPVSATPTVKSTITLSAADSDSASVTFTLTSITNSASGTGKFIKCSDDSVLAQGVLASAVTINAGVATTTVCYRNTGNEENLNDAKLTFTAKDNEGLVSNEFTVVVNVVGSRPNQPPVATQVGPFSLDQDTISQEFQLTGTDPDVDDQGKLQATFTSPSNGVLLFNNAAVSGNQGPAPYTLKYKPNAGFVGTDSFTFKITDSFGAPSSTLTITFNVKFVNHAPSVIVNSYSFTQLSSPEQQVTATDSDAGQTTTCKVTSLPASGILQTTAGSNIAVGNVITSYKVVVASPAPVADFDATFGVNCCDSFTTSLCTPATGSIHYTYVNQPPTGSITTVVTDQAVDKDFSFTVSDDLTATAQITILLGGFPANGVLKRADGSVITSTADKLANTFIYSPNPALSNANTPGGAGPLDTVTFYAVDADGLQSAASTAQFFVTPKPPPYFEGLVEHDTLEDTNLTFVLEAHAGDNGKDISLTITDATPDHGTLYQVLCLDAMRGCIKQVSNGDTITMALNKFQMIYSPPKDQYGDEYFKFSFIMKSNGVSSGNINITINVLPVNDPPMMVYLDPSNPYFAMPMNGSQVLNFTATDIDSDIYKLTCQLAQYPRRGKLYEYNKDNAANGFIGELIDGTKALPNLGSFNESIPNWFLVYVPDPSTSGTSYASIGVVISDFEGADTPTNKYIIDVSPVNVPPVITAEITAWNVSEGLNLIITGVSINDPDSRNNNLSLTVSIIDVEGAIQEKSTVVLANNYASACVSSPGSITCLHNNATLNNFLQQIVTNHDDDGTYFVQIHVDDLGYNSLPALRNVSHLTDTKNLTIAVSSGGVKKNTNTTVLSAAIAAAAVAAAIIALGVWRLLKKAAPPTDAFFGDSPFSDSSISANPLYQESGNTGNNPLYEQTA